LDGRRARLRRLDRIRRLPRPVLHPRGPLPLPVRDGGPRRVHPGRRRRRHRLRREVLMVDTYSMNADPDLQQPPPELPELIEISTAEARRIPSPGAQRALKAETGRTYDQLCGPDADGADRVQTLIWMKLRRDRPGLRWGDCAEVTVQVEEVALDVDPTKLVASASSPPSADSGD